MGRQKIQMLLYFSISIIINNCLLFNSFSNQIHFGEILDGKKSNHPIKKIVVRLQFKGIDTFVNGRVHDLPILGIDVEPSTFFIIVKIVAL